MQNRITGWLAVGLLLGAAAQGQAQVRCVNEMSGPGPFTGFEVRFEQKFGPNGEFVGPLRLPSGRDAHVLFSIATSYMAGRNTVAGATGDVAWMAIDPVVEYWTKAVVDDRLQFSAGVGGSFNYLRVLRAPDFFKTGAIVRGTIRLHLVKDRFALDGGFQGLAMLNTFKPSDFVPGATGNDFERFIPGGFLSARLNF